MKNASLHDSEYLDREALDAELVRVFEKCHDCRRCLPLCPSFPSLFDSIDRHDLQASQMEKAEIRREVEPVIGLLPSMLLGALASGLSVAFASELPLAPAHQEPLLVPAALSTVLVGFILLTTRIKAISQVLGYLVLENGIFLFGLLLVEAMPFLVEIGVLLDLFVGIFVISIIINHISREFATLDTRRLSSLKE